MIRRTGRILSIRVSSGRGRYHFRRASGATACAVDSGIGPVLDVVRGGGMTCRRRCSAPRLRAATGIVEGLLEVRTSCPTSRGIVPRRFTALWPIPEWTGKERDRAAKLGPHSGLGAWAGARVAPLRCPILRPGEIRCSASESVQQLANEFLGSSRVAFAPRCEMLPHIFSEKIVRRGPARRGDQRNISERGT